MLANAISASVVVLDRRRKEPRHGDIKRVVIGLLAETDHYEDPATRRSVPADEPGAVSVGLSYREIQERVRERFPGGRCTIMTVRSYARDAKLEGQTLPYRRPYSDRQRNPNASGCGFGKVELDQT